MGNFYLVMGFRSAPIGTHPGSHFSEISNSVRAKSARVPRETRYAPHQNTSSGGATIKVRTRIASPRNVPQSAAVASLKMFPFPHAAFCLIHSFVRVRRETGKKSVVRVHYGEGVAIHIVPESCADAREGIGEALAGERIGQAIEPRKKNSPGCRRRSNIGRQNGWVR